VGFLSKPDGRFETFFNALSPGASSGDKADELLMLSGFSRTHSFQLRAGHKVGYIYAETTIFRYIANSHVPKKWSQSNIDHIIGMRTVAKA
jgi:abelson tyrosine-protein kinase 1/abelson tyrosine-protein kinase 2